jgi:hypothetical protein
MIDHDHLSSDIDRRANLNIYQQLGEADPRPDLTHEEIENAKILQQEIDSPSNNGNGNGNGDDSPEMVETAFQIDQVQESAKNSMDFLAALAMPAVFKYLFPSVYLSIWQWLLTYAHKPRDFSQLALGLPRGFGKTAVIKLFVLYCILFTKKKFILILGENTTKAVNIVSDVMDMLNEPNIKKVFGDWKQGVETDRQDLKKFGFRGRNIIILAGTVETIRGVTLKNERPDVMIFDDIQSRSVAESQQVSDTLEREMMGTAMKAKSPQGCLFIFIGNMYPTKWSILRRLKTNPNWIKFIAGGILADGTSLWEDLQPIEQLHKEFQNDLLAGHPEIFYSEVLNDENATANNTIDISKIPPYPISGGDIPAAKFIVIDPSNDKATSDAVSIGYFEVHNGYPSLIKLVEGRLSPGDTIREALKLCFTYGVSLIAIESNAFQYSLLYWFNFICQQMGVSGIEPVEVYSGSSSKNSRILAMFLQLLRGEISIHPDCNSQAYLQISSFNPMRRDNTDGILDLLTYAPKVIELYAHQMLSSSIIMEQEYGQSDVQDFNSPF